MIHEIEPREGTVHAHYSPARPPALVVESGDSLVASTLDVSWGMEPPTSMTAPRRKFEPRDQSGPALLGPIGVRGAEPGDVLEVQIVACEPGAWGWTYAGAGFGDAAFNEGLGVGGVGVGGVGGEKALLRWDIGDGVAVNQLGHRVRVRAFLGVMGVSPGEPGEHSGWRPGAWGGNMDCRELVAGTSLFLPVLAPGALFSFGDGHAAQGDGEVSGTAIECAMRRVELRLVLRSEMKIAGPRARTPDAWVTMGFGESLDGAAAGAMAGMLDVMSELYALDRIHALALASAVVSLRVTQVVNGMRGVHAVLRHDAVERG